MAIIDFRWAIACLSGCIIFGNHYARDCVGALEKQMESDGIVTPDQYAALNSLYFFPNIITPLLAGVIAQRIGPSRALLISVCIAAIGHLCFSLGVYSRSYEAMACGRALAGCQYEVIDSLPILILYPLFESDWSTVVGILNGFLRLGSVVNFLLSPVLYRSGGILSAIAVSDGQAVQKAVTTHLALLSPGRVCVRRFRSRLCRLL